MRVGIGTNEFQTVNLQYKNYSSCPKYIQTEYAFGAGRRVHAGKCREKSGLWFMVYSLWFMVSSVRSFATVYNTPQRIFCNHQNGIFFKGFTIKKTINHKP